MAVGHINAAVGAHDHVIGLVEMRFVIADLARRAQAEQQLAARAEFVHLLALGLVGIGGEVSDPDIAFTVHVDAVGRDHHAGPEVGQHGAGGAVEFEDRVDQIGVTGDRRTGAEAASAAALVGPDLTVDRVNVDACGRAPCATSRQLTPVLSDDRVWVGHALAADDIACRDSRGSHGGWGSGGSNGCRGGSGCGSSGGIAARAKQRRRGNQGEQQSA